MDTGAGAHATADDLKPAYDDDSEVSVGFSSGITD